MPANHSALRDGRTERSCNAFFSIGRLRKNNYKKQDRDMIPPSTNKQAIIVVQLFDDLNAICRTRVVEQ